MDISPTFSWGDLDFQKFVRLASAMAVSVVVIFFLSKLKSLGFTRSNGKRLPGPRPWPIVGNLGLLGPLIHQDFAKLAKKYGPIFRFSLGSVGAIVVSSPELAREILKTHDHVFASRPDYSQSRIMAYNRQDGTSSPYGAYSRYVRKIFTLELLTAKRLQEFQSLRRREVLSMLHSILEDCKTGKAVSLPIPFRDMMKNNITQMAFSKQFFGPDATASDLASSPVFIKVTKELSRLYGVFVLGDHIPLFKYFDPQGYKKQMREVVRQMDTFLDKIIEEHRQRLRQKNSEQSNSHADRMDLVDVLLTRPSEGNDGKPLTDAQIKAILVSVLAAGTGTSSSGMEWVMTELLRHPAALQRAQQELDAVVGRDRLVEEADIPNLEYLCAVVKETLRLHPILPTLIPHFSIESCNVAGYDVPANTRVFVNVWAIGRDPAVWDRALDFEPERFLEKNLDAHGKDFKYIPFSSGRRLCPGRVMGFTMVVFAVSVLLHACNWTLPPGLSPQDLDVRERPGLSVAKAVPLEAVASPRLPLPIIYAA